MRNVSRVFKLGKVIVFVLVGLLSVFVMVVIVLDDIECIIISGNSDLIFLCIMVVVDFGKIFEGKKILVVEFDEMFNFIELNLR